MENRQSALWKAVTVPGAIVASVAVLAMMLIGVADIVATMLSVPIPGAFELIQLLMVLVIFLALPEVEARRQHITIDLLLQHVPLGLRRAVGIFNDLLSLLFYAAMAWQGWILFWNSWAIGEYAPGLIAFPIYPSKGLFAIGITLVCIVILVNLRRSLSGPASNEKG